MSYYFENVLCHGLGSTVTYPASLRVGDQKHNTGVNMLVQLDFCLSMVPVPLVELLRRKACEFSQVVEHSLVPNPFVLIIILCQGCNLLARFCFSQLGVFLLALTFLVIEDDQISLVFLPLIQWLLVLLFFYILLLIRRPLVGVLIIVVVSLIHFGNAFFRLGFTFMLKLIILSDRMFVLITLDNWQKV